MAKTIAGKNFVLLMDGKPFGCSQDASLSITTEFKESVGCREDAQVSGMQFKTRIPIGNDWSVSTSALFRVPETGAEALTMVTVPQLQKKQLEGHEFSFELEYDDADTTYNANYSGNLFISESGINAALADEAGGDISFVSNGALLITETLPA